MEQYKKDFIGFLVNVGALKFGEFKLKSGRVAPYFLNAGSFYSGPHVHKLGKYYAEAFLDMGINVDVIFGPAYKGIPLAVSTCSALWSDYSENVSYCFNRKEAKDYADKSVLVGAPLDEKTNVLIIDDVVTAGTAIGEAMDILKLNGNPKVLGVLIALDRMEKNNDGENAVKKLEKVLGVPVRAIVTLDEVIEVLYNKEVGGEIHIDDEKMEIINAYRAQYGV